MNQTLEKWLTIAALTGWAASIASLIGLAGRATAPAIASRPAQISAQPSRLSVQPTLEEEIAASSSLHPSIAATIPLDTSQGYWAKSLKDVSYAAK